MPEAVRKGAGAFDGLQFQLLTTKGSDTAKRMLDRRAPLSLPMARTNSRKGGFCPDRIASELPA